MVAAILVVVFGFTTYGAFSIGSSPLSEIKIPMRIFGTAAGVLSVVGFMPDVFIHTWYGGLIDAQGIAIRVGHHCAQPVHRHFGLYASNRASSGVYNSVEDAQALVEAAKGIRKFFGVE